MTPKPQRGTPAGDATLAIQKLARETGGDVQELLTLYVLEALLARISASPFRDDFVLKGGVLLAAFAARRPTKDIDLQATGFGNDTDDVVKRMSEITAINVPDGVLFDVGSLTASVIREGDAEGSTGVRVRLLGLLGRARIVVGIDINFGDPIWPEPQLIDVPRIVSLGQQRVRLLGYPLAMVLAEKIVTAIDRGEANTRWRDFADIYTLTRLHTVEAAGFRSSMEAVAAFRGVPLRPLLPALSEMPERAQPKWRAWRTRVNRQNELPESFAEVLNRVAHLSDPVVSGSAHGSWCVAEQRWVRTP